MSLPIGRSCGLHNAARATTRGNPGLTPPTSSARGDIPALDVSLVGWCFDDAGQAWRRLTGRSESTDSHEGLLHSGTHGRRRRPNSTGLPFRVWRTKKTPGTEQAEPGSAASSGDLPGCRSCSPSTRFRPPPLRASSLLGRSSEPCFPTGPEPVEIRRVDGVAQEASPGRSPIAGWRMVM